MRQALIIDDDPSIGEVLETLLETRGFAVDLLTDGIQAVDPGHHYDVILMDLKMPVFDGERLLDYWRATRPELLARVIVLSGYAYETRRGDARVFATIFKPFDVESLAKVIDACAARAARKGTPS